VTGRAPPLRRPAAPLRPWLLPVLTILAGSLATIVPMVASYAALPPFGLMLLLSWRLLRPDLLRVWAPLPLGFFDDLVSGQPLGSAMLFWTLCFLGVELIEQRLTYRDFRQDWAIGAGAVAATLIAGRLVATPLRAHVDTMLIVQILVSALLFPLVLRGVAALDRRFALR